MIPIASIKSRESAMAEALHRWRSLARKGFVPDYPHDAEQILFARGEHEVTVYRFPDGSEIAVGDAAGPWAAVITPAQGATR